MKNKNIIMSIFVAFALCLGLSSCEKDNDNDTNKPTTKTTDKDNDSGDQNNDDEKKIIGNWDNNEGIYVFSSNGKGNYRELYAETQTWSGDTFSWTYDKTSKKLNIVFDNTKYNSEWSVTMNNNTMTVTRNGKTATWTKVSDEKLSKSDAFVNCLKILGTWNITFEENAFRMTTIKFSGFGYAAMTDYFDENRNGSYSEFLRTCNPSYAVRNNIIVIKVPEDNDEYGWFIDGELKIISMSDTSFTLEDNHGYRLNGVKK